MADEEEVPKKKRGRPPGSGRRPKVDPTKPKRSIAHVPEMPEVDDRPVTPNKRGPIVKGYIPRPRKEYVPPKSMSYHDLRKKCTEITRKLQDANWRLREASGTLEMYRRNSALRNLTLSRRWRRKTQGLKRPKGQHPLRATRHIIYFGMIYCDLALGLNKNRLHVGITDLPSVAILVWAHEREIFSKKDFDKEFPGIPVQFGKCMKVLEKAGFSCKVDTDEKVPDGGRFQYYLTAEGSALGKKMRSYFEKALRGRHRYRRKGNKKR